MGRVVHFEIQVDDLERAKRINGGLLERAGGAPRPGSGANAFVCTIGVADDDATEALVLANGGTTALPKAALTGMAWQGYYLDTEGNVFGIHQPDEHAA